MKETNKYIKYVILALVLIIIIPILIDYLIIGNSFPSNIENREKERRALLRGNLVGDRHKYSSRYPFSGKVLCGNCGNIFKRRQWNSTNTSKKVVWQ